MLPSYVVGLQRLSIVEPSALMSRATIFKNRVQLLLDEAQNILNESCI